MVLYSEAATRVCMESRPSSSYLFCRPHVGVLKATLAGMGDSYGIVQEAAATTTMCREEEKVISESESSLLGASISKQPGSLVPRHMVYIIVPYTGDARRAQRARS